MSAESGAGEVGNIKFFDENRGFGFAETADGRSYFVHVSQLTDQNYFPAKGDRVQFEPDVGRDKRLFARRVSRVAA